MKDTMPESLSKKRNIIMVLAINDMYTENSGLYCFMMMAIMTAVKAIPDYFDNFHNYSSFLSSKKEFTG